MKRWTAAFLLVITLSFSACSPSVEEKDPLPTQIDIGVVWSAEAAPGLDEGDVMKGITLAHRVCSSVLGLPVNLHFFGEEPDLAQGEEEVQVSDPPELSSFLEDGGIAGIIGNCGTLLSSVPDDYELPPVIGCVPASASLPVPCFSISPSASAEGRAMAGYVVRELGAKTVVIVRDTCLSETSYLGEVGEAFAEAMAEYTQDEGAVLFELRYETGNENFTAHVTMLAGLTPDAVFVLGNAEDSARLVRRARALSVQAPFLGTSAWETPGFLSSGGTAIEGVAFASHYQGEGEHADEFAEAYAQEYEGEASVSVALGYDCYMLLLNAIERAAKAEPEAIRRAIGETEGFSRATGTITIGDDGCSTGDPIIITVKSGKLVRSAAGETA